MVAFVFLLLLLTLSIKSQEEESEITTQNLPKENVEGCVRCQAWKGKTCIHELPCQYCNETTPCKNNRWKCYHNICSYHGSFNSFHQGQDPFNRVIAFVLLIVFFSCLITICFKVYYKTCCNTRSQEYSKCFSIQCSVSLQCCCDWKTSRPRIIPSQPTNNRSNYFPRGRGRRGRSGLIPRPPPAYVDLYPDPHNHPEEVTTQENSSNQQITSNAVSNEDDRLRGANPSWLDALSVSRPTSTNRTNVTDDNPTIVDFSTDRNSLRALAHQRRTISRTQGNNWFVKEDTDGASASAAPTINNLNTNEQNDDYEFMEVWTTFSHNRPDAEGSVRDQ